VPKLCFLKINNRIPLILQGLYSPTLYFSISINSPAKKEKENLIINPAPLHFSEKTYRLLRGYTKFSSVPMFPDPLKMR
jgi:hypothetical protein